jgi:hypothetical protein
MTGQRHVGLTANGLVSCDPASLRCPWLGDTRAQSADGGTQAADRRAQNADTFLPGQAHASATYHHASAIHAHASATYAHASATDKRKQHKITRH